MTSSDSPLKKAKIGSDDGLTVLNKHQLSTSSKSSVYSEYLEGTLDIKFGIPDRSWNIWKV
jgi:hypothetical protein